MEQLRELIEMLGTDFLPCQSNKMGWKVRRLFDYLREADFPDEDVAAKKVGTTPGSSNFRKVKHYLKLALINGVTTVKPVTKSMAEEEMVDTNALAWNYAAALGASEGIVRDFLVQALSTGVLEVAKEFEADDSYPTILSQTFAHEAGKRAKRKVPVKEIAAVKEELAYAHSVQFFRQFSASSIFMNLTRAKDEEKAAFFNMAIEKLESISSDERYLTQFGPFYFKMKLHFVQREYQQAILLGKSGLQQWEGDKEDPLRVKLILGIQLNILRASLYGSYNREGLNHSLMLLGEITVNDASFYGFYEFGLIFALRCGEYETAYALYNRLLKSGKIEGLRQHFRETFVIIEAYIYILIENGAIKTSKQEKMESKFRLGRFLNEMNISHKEKRRRNVHLIIIKILFFSQHRDREDLEKSDAIRKYVQRYLKEKKDERAKNLLLAMILHPENGFNHKITIQKAEKYLLKMKERPCGSNQHDPYTEFIPYQEIWNILIG